MPAEWRRLLAATALVAIGPVRDVARVVVQDVDSRATRVFETSFNVVAPSEVVATIHAGCANCSWGAAGREAAALRLAVDGRYSQHLLLARGNEVAPYRVTLGALDRGRHHLTLELDPALSAARADGAIVRTAAIDVTDEARDEYLAQSMAPILHARPNTVGKFTDLPILMWYEVERTPRGRQFRYSVIFTNEDGGTATDRLMATWGRTTDIEFVYGAEVDDAGAIVREEFQGPGHQVPPFTGRHEGRHPLLWIATDNNMVSDAGATAVRYAPAPERFTLTDVSREIVMDAHPWSYQLAAQELMREGKIASAVPPPPGRIPDPRNFVIVEACANLSNAALAFSVRAPADGNARRWYDSDLGQADFRIVRTGCFRGAVALPAPAMPDAIRFRAVSRPQAGDPRAPAEVHLTRVNQVFTIGPDYLPRPSPFRWTGSLLLPIDGGWRELPF